MTRIFIEGQELDVNQGFTNQLTYSVDDLNNLDSKTTSFSKTIVLPGTNRNNKLLGNIFEVGNSNFTIDGTKNVGYNFNASKSAKAMIEMDGIQVMKGVLRLLEIIIDEEYIEYEVALFGELGGFISKLGAKKLKGSLNPEDDLDFSDYNHVYNITNIQNSWNITRDYVHTASAGGLTFIGNKLIIYEKNFYQIQSGDTIVITGTSNNGTYTVRLMNYDPNENSTTVVITGTFAVGQSTSGTVTLKDKTGYGYVYPLIDYGNVSTYNASNPNAYKRDYDVKTFRPAFFVNEIIDKIIKGTGYTYESEFFKSNFFRRLIIPNNNKRLLTNKTVLFVGRVLNNLNFGAGYTTIDLPFTSSDAPAFTTTDNKTFTYTSASAITQGSISINLQGLAFNCDQSSYLRLKVVLNGSQFYLSNPIYFNLGTNQPFNFDINISQISIYQNDTIKFQLVPYGVLSATLTNPYNWITINSNIPVILPVSYGDTLTVNELIPQNVLQKDFFTSILKMFNLMVSEDKEIDKHLIIEPYVDFYDTDRTTYLDWSDKIDRSQVLKLKPMSEANARYYTFKYKSDNDYYNESYRKKYSEGYGDRIYDNALEFAKETDNTEVIFSSTPLVGYSGRDKIVSSIFSITNGIEEGLDHNIRIMQFAKLSGYASWSIKNNTSTLLTTTFFPYAGHLDDPDVPAADLNFGATKELYFTLLSGALSNNLFNAYYSPYMAEITDKDSRLLTCKMKLTQQDIYNLDFGRFIFIDGVLYRLTKIKDWSENEIAEVELLRVIYTTY